MLSRIIVDIKRHQNAFHKSSILGLNHVINKHPGKRTFNWKLHVKATKLAIYHIAIEQWGPKRELLNQYFYEPHAIKRVKRKKRIRSKKNTRLTEPTRLDKRRMFWTIDMPFLSKQKNNMTTIRTEDHHEDHYYLQNDIQNVTENLSYP